MTADKIGEMEKRTNKIGRKYNKILNHTFLSNNILLETLCLLWNEYHIITKA